MSAKKPETFRPDAKQVLDTVDLIRGWIRWDHDQPGVRDPFGVCHHPDHDRFRMIVHSIAPHRITSLPRCIPRAPANRAAE